MKRIKQLLLALIVCMSAELFGMEPMRLTADELAKRQIERYLAEKKMSSPEQLALNAVTQHKITPEERASIIVEGRLALQELEDPANNLATLLAEVKRETVEQEKKEYEEKEDAIKWENTLLTPVHWKLGWYNRDFVEAGFIGAGILADVVLYQQLLKRRLDVVLLSMKTDYAHFIKLIQAVNRAEEKYEEQYEDKSALGKLFTNDKKNREALVGPLKKYVAEKHQFVGFWGLSKTTLFPLLFRWGFDKLSAALESSIISYDSYDLRRMVPKIFSQGRVPTEWRAFQQTASGTVVRAARTPFSFINIARFLQFAYNPLYTATKFNFPTYTERLKAANIIGDLHIPKFLFSNSVQLGIELIGLGFSAKMFDSMNSTVWSQYCAAHREELLACLEGYRDAKENPNNAEQSIAQAEQKLKKFIEKGHERESWVPGSLLRQWWGSRSAGESRIPFWTSLVVAAILGYKGYKWYHGMKNGQDQEEAPAGQDPVGQPAT